MAPTSIAVLLFSLTSVLSSVLAQQCIWSNGQEATDYFACNPENAQSSCCWQGEACVANGYCYGSLGVPYRGACAGGWGNNTACPTACNDQGADGGWANMLQCYSVSAPSGATSWWCGDESVVSPCDEEGTNSNPTKAQIFSLPWNGLTPLSLMPSTSSNFSGCAMSLDNPYNVEKQIENATSHNSGSSGSSGSTGSTSTPTTTTVQKTCPNGAKIGEGVAIGVVALIALAMAAWALYERKQKNKVLAGAGGHKRGETQQYHQPQPHQQQQPYYDQAKDYSTPAPQYQSPHRPPPSEMDSFGNGRSRAHEMQS